MIEYDKERQEHLEPGFLEPTVDDNLLTREIPVEIKVCVDLLFDLFWQVGCMKSASSQRFRIDSFGEV